MKKLPREFYNRETSLVAQELLGCYLIHRCQGIELVGKIVEVEAYLGSHDLASHTSKGLTKRTATMFGPPGFAYVYLIYGMYHCLNVVTESEGNGAAVLIRAIEPFENIQGRTSGPGLLCKSMMIDKRHNNCDFLSDTLFITEADPLQSIDIIATPRIGIPYAKEWIDKLLRFYISGNDFISKK
jgi:DNA-3-methyladenine glycosylase